MNRLNQTPERPHKVAFSGAGYVGKTALTHAMKEQPIGFSTLIIAEAAREYYRQHPDIPESEHYNFEHQSYIQTMIMNAEEYAHRSSTDLRLRGPDYVFTDGSALDAPVRVAANGGVDAKTGADALFNRARMSVPGASEVAYSQIYVLDPADVPYETDDARKESPDVRLLHHEMFLAFFRHYDVRHKLLSGTLDERTEQVLADLPVFERQTDF